MSTYVCGKHSSVQISGYLIGMCIVWEWVLTPSIFPCIRLIWILPCLGGNPISVVDGAVNESSVCPFRIHLFKLFLFTFSPPADRCMAVLIRKACLILLFLAMVFNF